MEKEPSRQIRAFIAQHATPDATANWMLAKLLEAQGAAKMSDLSDEQQYALAADFRDRLTF